MLCAITEEILYQVVIWRLTLDDIQEVPTVQVTCIYFPAYTGPNILGQKYVKIPHITVNHRFSSRK
jgi:hypothetical protein